MYRKNTRGILKHMDFAILDIICMLASYCLACSIRFGLNWQRSQIAEVTLLFYMITNLTVSTFNESYKNILHRGYLREFRSCVKHVVLITMFVAVLLFFSKNADLQSRLVVLYTTAVYLPFTYFGRVGYKTFMTQVQKNREQSAMLIVTTEDLLSELTDNIYKNDYQNYSIHGIIVLDRDMTGEYYENIPIVADAKTMVSYVCRNWVDEVFLNIPNTQSNVVAELINTLLEMGVAVHERLYTNYGNDGWQHTVEHLGHYTVLTSALQAVTLRQAICKRVLDICGALVGLVITGLLTIVIGPMIYMQSPGPIFFAQERIGKNGRVFKMYKVRSMYLDAEERKKEFAALNRVSSGMMFKLDWDPRIIGNVESPDGTRKSGIGEFIRKTSLDEFPQFLIVLKGDMSLVGTRPPTLDEWEKYESHHRARMATKPGITGMWQISGRSEITDFEEVVRLDREYISNWTLGLDLKILFKTVQVVLRREGSM